MLLPDGHRWYDWHSGAQYDGGQSITVHAPLDTVPMFVRAGAILPWGKVAISTQEQAKEMPEMIIFPGEDGSFTWYDDAGDGYGYEKGEWIRIPMQWHDVNRTLTLGKRMGTYPGMKETCVIRVRLFGKEPIEIQYSGAEMQVQL